MCNALNILSWKTSLVVPYLQNYVRGYMGATMSLQIVLNAPKNLYLNQATQKDTYQIFLLIPKKSRDQKF